MKALTSTDKATVRFKGQELKINLLKVSDQKLIITGYYPKICQLKDEWYQDLNDAESFINTLIANRIRADVFTFIERPPTCTPNYSYYVEWDNVAAINLTNYDYWWQKQINSKTRALVRRAQKNGVYVKLVTFNDDLLKGIEEIYNEAPMRQGKPFWHYKKGLEYLKRVHETFLDKSDFLGAYYNEELIGFVKLVYAGETANTMHIISKNSHRDKSVTNALVAKAVERSCEKGARYLVYDKYDYELGGSPSLLLFKRNNGFSKLEFPRYYIPLTKKGKIALKIGLHHGLIPILPKELVKYMLRIRNNLRIKWYKLKYETE